MLSAGRHYKIKGGSQKSLENRLFLNKEPAYGGKCEEREEHSE